MLYVYKSKTIKDLKRLKKTDFFYRVKKYYRVSKKNNTFWWSNNCRIITLVFKHKSYFTLDIIKAHQLTG